MGVTYSYEPLERVLYFDHGPARPADAYLRESVEQVPPREGDPNPGPPLWRADEVHVKTWLSEQEVEAAFDELWVEAVAASRPVEERLAELEQTMGALVTVALGKE